MSGEASTVIIPVENQVRELDAKLLLGCVAAERGFPVILGSRTYIHFQVDSMPRGVYLAKSMRRLSETMFDIVRRLGHEIVAFDEEGLVRPPDAHYYARRLSEVAVRQVSALLAWGPDNAMTFRKFPACHGIPIHVTGNPRIDMLRPEVRPFHAERVRRLQERFGRFILVNSNFGHVNHYVPSLRVTAEGGEGIDEFTAALAAHRLALFGHFGDMIRDLSLAFPGHTILVRPHPIESHEPWKELARDLSNVVVENEGNVVPWLMACDVLVQNGCQTAIEASLVGTPVVNFKPVASELDIELIESLSHEALDREALVATVRSIVSGELGPRDHPDRKRDLEQHIAALDGPLASERMVDVLEEAGYASHPPPSSSGARRLSGRIRNRLRTALKQTKMRRPGNRNSRDYHAHRFPDLTLEDVRHRIGRLGRQLGRFEELRVRRGSRHIFHIEPSRPGGTRGRGTPRAGGAGAASR